MAWEAPGGANENAEAHSAYGLPLFRCPLATVELDELVMNLLSEGKKGLSDIQYLNKPSVAVNFVHE